MRCERSRAWMPTAYVYIFIYVHVNINIEQKFFFFFSNWDGAPLGFGALRKLCTPLIGSGSTVLHDHGGLQWTVSLSCPNHGGCSPVRGASFHSSVPGDDVCGPDRQR